MKKIFTFIFIICLLTVQSFYAQKISVVIDSLQTALKTQGEDTIKVDILSELAWQNQKRGNYTEAEEFAEKAMILAKQLSYSKGEGYVHQIRGVILKNQGHYKEALVELTQSLELREKIGDKKGCGSCLANIGSCYGEMGQFSKALEFHNRSLRIKEETKDKKGLAVVLTNIGNVNRDLGDYPKAAEFYTRALKLKEELGDVVGSAAPLNNLGLVYFFQKNYAKALEYYFKALNINEEADDRANASSVLINIGAVYDSKGEFSKALEVNAKALKIKRELKDKNGIAYVINNMGAVYEKLKDYTKAMAFYKEALALRVEMQDKNGEAECLLNLGNVYRFTKDLHRAHEYLEKSIALSKEIGALDYLKDGYSNLSALYEEEGNVKKELEYFQLFVALKDSMMSEEGNKQIALLSTQYETDKKDAEIKLLNKEKENQEMMTIVEKRRQRWIVGTISGILLLLFVFSIFVLRSNRQRKRANIEITLQKEIIETRNKEVHDSITYAKRIQNAILPSEKSIIQLLPESFVLFKSKDIVSGDFYWFENTENRILFAAVDCTGHGVPGAMVSVVGHNALNRALKEFGLTKPSDILDKLTELVEETFERSESDVKDGMDISLCSLERKNNGTTIMQWSGANNPVWLIRDGKFEEIKADKQPIGKFEMRKPFTNHSVELKKGDLIYIFTDGFADQFGGPKVRQDDTLIGRGKKFKHRQMQEIITGIASKNMSDQKNILNEAFESWKGSLEQVDDVCVIGVRL